MLTGGLCFCPCVYIKKKVDAFNLRLDSVANAAVKDLGIDQCEVKILMQEAAKPDHGWLDSTGQQLMGTFSSSSGTGNNQRTHSYTAPTGPPMGYNVILIGGPAPGSPPGCRKALVWPPNSPSQVPVP